MIIYILPLDKCARFMRTTFVEYDAKHRSGVHLHLPQFRAVLIRHSVKHLGTHKRR